MPYAWYHSRPKIASLYTHARSRAAGALVVPLWVCLNKFSTAQLLLAHHDSPTKRDQGSRLALVAQLLCMPVLVGPWSYVAVVLARQECAATMLSACYTEEQLIGLCRST